MKESRFLMTCIFCAMLTLGSCKKEEDRMSKAFISGFDYTKCMCCGGYQITIEGVQPPAGSGFFLTGSLPQEFNLGATPAFPLPVLIDWEPGTGSCTGRFIIVKKIKKR